MFIKSLKMIKLDRNILELRYIVCVKNIVFVSFIVWII